MFKNMTNSSPSALVSSVKGVASFLAVATAACASVALASDLFGKRKLMETMQRLQSHDTLTDLLNRGGLQERLEKTHANHARAALVMVGIESFQRVNDSLGRDGGDAVLRAFSERLSQQAHDASAIARISGDRFAVLVTHLNSAEQVRQWAIKLRDALQREVSVSGSLLHLTVNIGIAMARSSIDSQLWLARAETALATAARGPRGSIAMQQPEPPETSASPLQIESELRTAIRTGQFELRYQALVESTTGNISGVEALLRWKHPQRGLLVPVHFIDIAEQSGLIVPIGEWVLRRACEDIGSLSRKVGRRLRLAVNIAEPQLRHRNFARTLRRALQRSRLAPEDLELEITERLLVADCATTRATLDRVRKLCVKLTIDDFGTGFSNFNYLLEFSVDALKIDRSFIARCPGASNASAIVHSVLAMARSLKIRTVGEGVETQEQVDFLVERRCDEMQGYFFNRPMPINELQDIVRTSDVRTAQPIHLPDEHEVFALA